MPDKSGNFFDGIGLVDLEKILTTELEHLKYPGKNWVPKKEGITDIVIVGGGMCGMVVWHSLVSGGIQNVRILDKSIKGNDTFPNRISGSTKSQISKFSDFVHFEPYITDFVMNL